MPRGPRLEAAPSGRAARRPSCERESPPRPLPPACSVPPCLCTSVNKRTLPKSTADPSRGPSVFSVVPSDGPRLEAAPSKRAARRPSCEPESPPGFCFLPAPCLRASVPSADKRSHSRHNRQPIPRTVGDFGRSKRRSAARSRTVQAGRTSPVVQTRKPPPLSSVSCLLRASVPPWPPWTSEALPGTTANPFRGPSVFSADSAHGPRVAGRPAGGPITTRGPRRACCHGRRARSNR